uniref:Uncharacterized protein n=1 Tax=Arundo donax TaxID=35708 RepID=A0A0A9A4V1_ARUDO
MLQPQLHSPDASPLPAPSSSSAAAVVSPVATIAARGLSPSRPPPCRLVSVLCPPSTSSAPPHRPLRRRQMI